jgi:hypothetical protein
LTDYYSILSRAVASLDSNTAQARAALFERARGLLINRIENDRERWTDDAALAEIANFDATTDRIESDMARRTTNDSVGRYRQYQPAGRTDRAPAPSHDVSPHESKRGIGRIAVLGAAGLLGVLLIGLAVYAFRGQQTTATKASGKAAIATAPESVKKAASRPSPDGDDLEPGIDGGSTGTGLPYYLQRQAVYYRSVYSTAGWSLSIGHSDSSTWCSHRQDRQRRAVDSSGV